MKRFLISALWGVIFYFLGYVLVATLVEAPAMDAWNPLIALIAAILAAAGSWKGWLPGTRMFKDNSD
jgi:membrane protein DedA with SNARE-associated domain